MPAPQTLECPNCGARLSPPGANPTMECAYCHVTLVLPEEWLSGSPAATRASTAANEGTSLGKLFRLGEVTHLAFQGRTEQAVQRYQELTGAGEDAAREAVRNLQSGLPVMIQPHELQMEETPAVQVFSSSYATTSRPSSPRVVKISPVFKGLLVLILLVSCAASIIPLVAGGALTAFLPQIIGGVIEQTTPQAGLPVNLPVQIPGINDATPTPAGPGRELLSFGAKGTGRGQFEDARAVTVDGDGNIYVAEYSDGRLQAFAASGKFSHLWMLDDDVYSVSLAAAPQGHVFVARGGKLLQFDGASGELIGEFGPQEDGSGDRIYYEEIALTPQGGLAVISGGSDLLVLDQDGKIILELPDAIGSVTGDRDINTMLAVDGRGNMFLLGSFTSAVFQFDSSGKFINRFGSDGDQPGQLRAVNGIAVDGQGRVFVSNVWGIEVFHSDGRYIGRIDPPGVPFGLAIDSEDHLYAITNQPVLVKYEVP